MGREANKILITIIIKSGGDFNWANGGFFQKLKLRAFMICTQFSGSFAILSYDLTFEDKYDIMFSAKLG